MEKDMSEKKDNGGNRRPVPNLSGKNYTPPSRGPQNNYKPTTSEAPKTPPPNPPKK